MCFSICFFIWIRKALEDRDLAKLLNATQDTLQILSKEGIYLDALNVEPGDVKLWRDFGKGKRGKSLSAQTFSIF